MRSTGNNMKVSNVSVVVDDKTFQPRYKFEVELTISMEKKQDVDAFPLVAEGFYKTLGYQVYTELMKQAKEKTE